MPLAFAVIFVLALGCFGAQAITNPIVVPASGLWDGIDGPWSTFNLSYYSASNDVTVNHRVLPGFSQSFVSLPSEAGCPDDALEEILGKVGNWTGWRNFTGWNNCSTSRGGLFKLPQEGNSDNFGGIPTYTYKKLVPFGMNVTGVYAWGQAGIQKSNMKNQTVGEYTSPNLWLGSMGINPIASNYSNDPPSASGNEPGPTFFDSVMPINHTTGRSWSYTAGAVNRPGSPLGSLVLGGYDEARIDHGSGMPASFQMAPYPGLELMVRVFKLTLKAGSKTTFSNQMESDLNMDPLVAHIGLDELLCKTFEELFGVTWEAETNMYFINDTQHEWNLSQNISLTFSIGHHNTNITFPYTDFALTASYPLVATNRRYFPLRRATQFSQFVLGRAFLQGAYLIADYDRKTFNISQAKTSKNLKSRILAIPPPAKNATNDTVIPIGLLPGNKIAEARNHETAVRTRVAVGASLTSVLILLSIIRLLMWRRDRKSQALVLESDNVSDKKTISPPHFDGKAELDGKSTLPPEVQADDIKELDALQIVNELEARKFGYELPAAVPAELYGDMPWQEKDAYVHELEACEKKHAGKWWQFLRRKSEKKTIITFDQGKSAVSDKSPFGNETHVKKDEELSENQEATVTEESLSSEDSERTENKEHQKPSDNG